MTSRPAVSIVVPVWNAADVTRTCLRLLPDISTEDHATLDEALRSMAPSMAGAVTAAPGAAGR